MKPLLWQRENPHLSGLFSQHCINIFMGRHKCTNPEVRPVHACDLWVHFQQRKRDTLLKSKIVS